MDHQLTHREVNFEHRSFPLVVACDNWRDPLNVGAAFRLADAFGVEHLLLGGESPAPPHRRIRKTARSTEQWVPFNTVSDLASELQRWRERGYSLLGLEITARSVPLPAFPLQQHPRIVLVAGAEQQGLSPAILKLLDATVHLPMYGRNTSLNVATALGIALYEISRAMAGEQ